MSGTLILLATLALSPVVATAGTSIAGGEAFTDLAYEQAAARAAEEGRFFLVDATADWCGPCKRMEATTWTDEAVLAWLAEHALAVQVDVDRQPRLAKDLRIGAMPTMIIFRDGEEVDRIVGYRDGDGMLTWLEDVEQGKRAIDRLRGDVETADPGAEVETRFSLAKTLSDGRDFDEALEQYVWLWENAATIQPSWSAVRRSFLVNAVATQARVHEPTREAFEERLDTLDQAVREPEVGFDTWADWNALCRALEQEHRLLALYEERRASDGSARSLPDVVRDPIFELLVADGRLDDAAAFLGDVENLAHKAVEFDQLMVQMEPNLPPEQLDMSRAFRESRLREDLAQLAAVAGVSGRADSSLTVSSMLLERLDDADSRMALVDQATRFGWADARHARWLDEAEQEGEDVATLRMRLVELSARDG